MSEVVSVNIIIEQQLSEECNTMGEKAMTIEEMRQKASEARKAAKTLQCKLQTITDPVERKQLAREMNDLFVQARNYTDEATHRHRFEECVERELNSLQANLEDD